MVSRLLICLLIFLCILFSLHRGFLFISGGQLRAFIVKGIGLQTVSVKDQIVSIAGFEDCRVYVAVTQLCCCSRKQT